MARWKLNDKHHLNVVGTKWEYTETDRSTGRPKRKQFDVPTFLDPADPGQWTVITAFDQGGRPADGDIVVCWEGKGQPKDLVFTGDPTPDMTPLDEEAEAISAECATRWKFGVIDAGNPDAANMTALLLGDLGQKLSEAIVAKDQGAVAGNSAALDKMLETMNSMMQQNAQLIALLTAQATQTSAPRRP